MVPARRRARRMAPHRDGRWADRLLRLARAGIASWLLGTSLSLAAEPMAVVAIGASNTSGWGVGEAAAYPARLEALLRACGLDVRVVNAGIPFETTNGMLARIDRDVPDEARAVVIQPGGNDLRFLGTPERRAANIAAMTERLAARGIPAVVYDPVFRPEEYQWDGIHVTAAAHRQIARDLLPEIAATLAPKPTDRRERRPKAARDLATPPCSGGASIR